MAGMEKIEEKVAWPYPFFSPLTAGLALQWSGRELKPSGVWNILPPALTGTLFDQGIDSGTPLACGWTLVFGFLLGVWEVAMSPDLLSREHGGPSERLEGVCVSSEVSI